ncbi:COMM domain-containing protein 5 [Aethina tumida]|uniref:COMM domain-containing protein 5 n=1 Tax=Aethina tumida TaxID=116153 RepID=UPI00096AE642|nr:COMM domain-containing protein 5 [Aethina tumida]
MNLTQVPKTLINTVCETQNEVQNRVLKLALAIQQSPNQDRTKIIDKICHEFNIPKETLHCILAVYLSLIRFFLEVNDKEYNSRLLELGFTENFVESLPLISNREDVVNKIQFATHTDFGKLSYLKWRIDISLVNSTLVKKVPTSVILSVSMKNQRKITITVDAKNYHKLRFNIALILKELTCLKANYLNK